MLTSNEFNALVHSHAKEKLLPAGFKKQNNLFYLHQSPNILVLCKRFYKENFHGFYIALTNDFFDSVKGEGGSLKLSSFLEEYPFSIPVDELEDQYKKSGSVIKFKYDTNFLTREVLATRKNGSSPFSLYDKMKAKINGPIMNIKKPNIDSE